LKRNNAAISRIIPGSIAEEAGIETGDAILSINDAQVKDIFDYRFLCTDEIITVKVCKKNRDILEVEISKDEYEDIGIEFDTPLIDKEKSCTNKCIFCFIDQMPPGMRNTLYFKDDDPRLSFLMGNYVTLTNINDSELERIIRYRFSPINVSVHTTNPSLREFMMGNRFAGDVLKKIKRLTQKGITVNCQIVLCKGINDKEQLDRTISDLSGYFPGMNSLSVVPVGITRFREGLYKLIPYDIQSSRQVVEQIERWQQIFMDKHGSRIVYPADEFYIMGGMVLPQYEYYEEFPQIENGVGLVRQFLHEFVKEFENLTRPYAMEKPRTVSIATGVSIYPFIKDICERLEERIEGLCIKVYNIENRFFGENVTVTGLLTGQDICSQLDGRQLGDELLISRSMLKSGEQVFLDDVSVDDIEKMLKVRVRAVENCGSDFIRKVLRECAECQNRL
jgi:putative radical SAM enzyme (TIGR03279 family)